MDRDELITYLKEGLSTRDIEKVTGLNHRTVNYWIDKLGLKPYMKYQPGTPYCIDAIDTPEKAYTVGFIAADSYISNNNNVEIAVAVRDEEVLRFISKIIDANIRTDMSYDSGNRRFPRCRMSKKIKDINKFLGGTFKEDRHYPRVREELERYLLLGFFDADGCLTWGRRKDRDRIWQKITFSSQLNLLLGVQQYLIKNGISSAIRPKTGEKCYVLDFSDKQSVIKFLDLIYPNEDFIILKRKYHKYRALRLELEENGETAIERQRRAEPAEPEGVETTGDVAKHLNNQTSIQAPKAG